MSEIKDTNPKDSVGIKKVPFSLIPENVNAEVGLAFLEGARKYGSYNWRVAGVRASVYIDALRRHLGAWWNGENIDKDSGLSHIVKAIACLMILRDSMIVGNWVDDRPPKLDDYWIQELNKKAAEIIDKYPVPMNPYLEIDNKLPKNPDLNEVVLNLLKPYFEGTEFSDGIDALSELLTQQLIRKGVKYESTN